MTEPTSNEELLHTLALDYLQQQRSQRRWKLFKRIAIVALVLLFIVTSYSNQAPGRQGDHVGLININGTIASDTSARADYIATALDNAYKAPHLKAIILRINSPGGSPVQASYAYQEIRRMKAKHSGIPIIAVCTEMCASAAYYIASAADEIYADPASIVGSIGVLYNGFGFNNLIGKLGVDRRLITAGADKGMLDPFSPPDEKSTQFLQAMLNDVHRDFINSVQQGRGDKLSKKENLFTGKFWNGRRAKELGLIDGLGSPGFVAREVLKQQDVVNYTYKENPLEQFVKKVGASVSGWVQQEIAGAFKPALF